MVRWHTPIFSNRRFAFRTFPWSNRLVFPVRSIILAILEAILGGQGSALPQRDEGEPVSGERAARL